MAGRRECLDPTRLDQGQSQHPQSDFSIFQAPGPVPGLIHPELRRSSAMDVFGYFDSERASTRAWLCRSKARGNEKLRRGAGQCPRTCFLQRIRTHREPQTRPDDLSWRSFAVGVSAMQSFLLPAAHRGPFFLRDRKTKETQIIVQRLVALS